MLANDYTLIHSDGVSALMQMPDACVDAIVTDPPYELGFMGKAWDASGIANNVEMWREALRVLKPGGHMLAFSGSRTYHRMTCAIEDAGFEVRDQIMWLYGSGFPKSRNIAEMDMEGEAARQWQGWGTALKPAHEPICVARKPLVGTVAENVLAHGTGALNIDGCRVGDVDGRWPANLIHDGSDEVVGAFPESKSGGYPPEGGQRSQVSTYGKPTARGEQKFTSSEGSAARFFYCAKASKRDRDDGLDGFQEQRMKALEGGKIASGKTPDAMGGERTGRNIHPTVKPTDLMRYLCRLVTPPGGVVLDPFMGSGSTGKAAILEGFRFIGIDMTAEYVEIARARIQYVTGEDLC